MRIRDRLAASRRPSVAPDFPLPVNLSRRQFVQGAGGLALGICLGPALSACGRSPAPAGTAPAATADFVPNAFVRIGRDNVITVIAKHLEMGQGTYTGLSTLLAEELDADWEQVRVEGAPANQKLYANLSMGGIQGTGGSSAIANSYEQLRRAGATARAMLVSAAAAEWSVPAGEITVERSVVRHAASGRQATFGALADAAGRQPVPGHVTLKKPEAFTLIGRQTLSRRDSAAKTDGSAIFTQDVKLPGMLVAVAALPPRFGSRLKSVDAAKARAIPGVVDVVRYDGGRGYPDGVAVLARNTWIARQGRDALVLEWDDRAAVSMGSSDWMARYREMAKEPGTPVRHVGDAAAALAKAGQVIEADYEFPYLAHAAMEPMNCLVHLTDGACEIYNGEQFQTIDQENVARLLGLPQDKVTIHQLYAGGSFGRRANGNSDYLMAAASIARGARAQGHAVPVKLVWMREDDMKAGYFRPMFHHRVRAAAAKDGRILGWEQRVVGQSILKGTPFAGDEAFDEASVEGCFEQYAASDVHIDLHTPDPGVPVQWWRSVGHTHTAYVKETMMDELAASIGADPFEFRRQLLTGHPRHKAVLELAAGKAGWTTPLAPGKAGEKRGRGIALQESFDTIVAQVIEATVVGGTLRVDRVVCAVDCGIAVNPDVIRAQMEGGIGFALSAALHGAVTHDKGAVVETNFHTYRQLRIDEMPLVEVHILPSAAPPTGVGEPGVPPAAPALANAIFAATGRRIRRMPLGKQLEA